MDQIAVSTFYPFVIGGPLQCRQCLMHLRDVLFRYIVGVGPRIGNHLMLLVERLGDIECFFGGKSVFPVRLTLQQRQIV
ncbi:hypothetical protein D3C81_1742390 [compost metagenome]